MLYCKKIHKGVNALFRLKKKNPRAEDAICALCEYSKESDGKFFCASKEVDAVGYCGKFIFDPLKKRVKRISVEEKTKDIEFLPLE